MTTPLMSTYNPLPISIERGEGVWLWDKQGNKYLDAFAGIAVTNLGHAHPVIVKHLQEQVSKIIHVSHIFTIPEELNLAKKLLEISGMDQAFFANSGAEANECAIKLARMFGHHKNLSNPTIIVMEKAFHGRTLATLTASGNRRVQAGFEPLVRGFIRAPYNDPHALRSIAKNAQDIVAVMLEPIQGESGIWVPDDNYLEEVRKICDEQGWLMILDEVQTGMGRTGQWFAYQHTSIKPDIVTSAKALGNGLPIGACLTRDIADDLFKPGNHGSTFGGNPLCSSTALKVIETLSQEKAVENAAKVGAYLLKELQQRLSQISGVIDIRGKGLLIGIELDRPCREILALSAKKGLFISVTGETVIRLAPPLILKEEQADIIVNVLAQVLPEFLD